MTQERRMFLRGAVFAVAAVTFIPAWAKDAKGVGKKPKDSKPKEADLPLVQESATTKALKYYEDGAKVPAADRQAKSGIEPTKQNCLNCMFYKAAGKNAGKEVGKCQLLPEGHVPSSAWCMSWTLKA